MDVVNSRNIIFLGYCTACSVCILIVSHFVFMGCFCLLMPVICNKYLYGARNSWDMAELKTMGERFQDCSCIYGLRRTDFPN